MSSDAVVAFHASSSSDITSFKQGTHFGSKEAALERASANKYKGIDMVLYEVEIRCSRVLEIYDEGTSHTLEYLIDAIRSADRKALHGMAVDAILDAEAKDGSGMKLLGELVQSIRGYDALSYENNAEDDGSISWVVLNPEIVTIRSVEALSQPAPAL